MERICDVLVRFDPVKSADPPTIVGTAALITSSAICDACRLATFGNSAFNCFLYRRIRVASAFGSSPDMARSKRDFLTLESKRDCHWVCISRPRVAIACHSDRMSEGISKGG